MTGATELGTVVQRGIGGLVKIGFNIFKRPSLDAGIVFAVSGFQHQPIVVHFLQVHGGMAVITLNTPGGDLRDL